MIVYASLNEDFTPITDDKSSRKLLIKCCGQCTYVALTYCTLGIHSISLNADKESKSKF